jgi:hypothetical protein
VSTRDIDIVALLSALVHRLEGVYAGCVTAEVALTGQNADHDAEIARCLRAGVSETLAAELYGSGRLSSG